MSQVAQHQHSPASQAGMSARKQALAHQRARGLLLLFLGLICGITAAYGSLIQIQTSEAFLLNGAVQTFLPAWEIIMQPVHFASGILTIDQAKAFTWGFGIELLFLTFALGFDIAHQGIAAHSKRSGGVFLIGGGLLIVLNSIADFSFGSIGSGFWGHLGFTVVCLFAVLFLGLVAIKFIETGIALLSGGTPVSLAASPLPKIVIGLFDVGFFLMILLFQIQTSEAFFLSLSSPTFVADYGILLQPVLFFEGRLSGTVAMAAMWGYIVEIAYLILIIGFDLAREGIGHTSKKLVGWFITGIITILILDVLSDFLYGVLPSGILGQLAFAGITSFTVFYFGTAGVHLIVRGITDWSK